MDPLNRDALALLIASKPEFVPILGSIVGLSQEQLKNILRFNLGTSSWRLLAKSRSHDVIAMLDEELGLVPQIEIERHRSWSYADILFERVASKSRAGLAIGRGRRLEDDVEALVKGAGLSYEVRSRFSGRAGRTAPCDVAIPSAGDKALIVAAVKGFDSTGSKLTDAVREIEQMAEVRDPRQFVYAVVDGIGWLSRQADLRRIHQLWVEKSINGLFTRSQLDSFRVELQRAAKIHGLV